MTNDSLINYAIITLENQFVVFESGHFTQVLLYPLVLAQLILNYWDQSVHVHYPLPSFGCCQQFALNDNSSYTIGPILKKLHRNIPLA